MSEGVLVFAGEGLLEAVDGEFGFTLCGGFLVIAEYCLMVDVPVTFVKFTCYFCPWDEEGDVELAAGGGAGV